MFDNTIERNGDGTSFIHTTKSEIVKAQQAKL